VDRDEAGSAATEARVDPTFDGCRVAPLARAWDAFLEPFEGASFRDFCFKRTDLVAADARPVTFFAGFDFPFAFVAINAATYTNYVS